MTFTHKLTGAPIVNPARIGQLIDVQARMLWLSTYLGQHVEPSDTYRYLTAAPELLALAATRLQATLGDLP